LKGQLCQKLSRTGTIINTLICQKQQKIRAGKTDIYKETRTQITND